MPQKETQATLLAADYEGAPITREEVKLLVAEYNRSTQHIDGKSKTKSVWFKYEVIEDMFKQLKAERENNVGTDGLRVFFGTYPEVDPQGNRYEFQKRNTVVFVSTKEAIADDGKVYHKNYFDHPASTEKGLLSDPINRGELCEPNCNGADEGLK